MKQCIKSYKRLRLKAGKYEDLEEILASWMRQARACSIPIDGDVLKTKALKIAKELNTPDFTAPNGWLHRFKACYDFSLREISGEANAVNEGDVRTWINATLPSLMKDYMPEDIYNADEFGLFFKVLPNKTFAFKDDNCHGGKYSKERLSVLVCINSTGTHKLEPLVIGKSQRPRCFKNVKKFSCAYSHQRRAWMTAVRFHEWLADLNSEMKKRKRHILLFVDNCPAHPKNEKFSNVRVEFLPANTTSHLQPLDQGIIRVLKHYYRKKLVLKYIDLSLIHISEPTRPY